MIEVGEPCVDGCVYLTDHGTCLAPHTWRILLHCLECSILFRSYVCDPHQVAIAQYAGVHLPCNGELTLILSSRLS